ncbi:hypothetical protein NP493_1303g00026 [Ridgeia piscesae]|uniref:Uncharacterized protein n=1 Tax=Ridgeia piscesae TaxID=27915 RepID=A0AAD9KA96_RIDPI|nr:hypothetical protein NP493_1303g00026 [Ridgeia piscesae]
MTSSRATVRSQPPFCTYNGHTTEIVKNLEDRGYDYREVPVNRNRNATVVSLGVTLKRIVFLEEKQQHLLTNVWMHQSWTDANIHWEPAMYNNTRNIHIPVHTIWRPDIRIYDSVDTSGTDQGYDSIAHITHRGAVSNSYPLMLKTACRIHVYYFPFDTQVCNLTFSSWSYDRTVVDLVPGGINLDEYDKNTAWKLVKTKMTVSSDNHRGFDEFSFRVLTVTVTLRRASDIVFYYLYLPIVFFNIITVAQYMLPCDSMKKITLTTTMFFGMTFYVLLLKSSLPIGHDVPSIVKFVTITLSLVGMSLLINVLLLSMHQRGPLEDNFPLPPWARDLFLHKVAHLVGMRSYVTPDDEHAAKVAKMRDARAVRRALNAIELCMMPLLAAVPSATSAVMAKTGSRDHSSFMTQRVSKFKIKGSELSVNKDVLLLRTFHTLSDLEQLWEKQEVQNEMHLEWEQMAVVVGRLVMFIYLIITAILWVVVFIIDQPKDDCTSVTTSLCL